MSRGGSRGWEIHLGLVSIVALLGITLGCIFGAFYLGYYTGRTIGFTMARDAAQADVAKLPVPAEMTDEGDAAPAKVAQIYDRLNEPARLPAAEPTRAEGKNPSKRDDRSAKLSEMQKPTPPADTSADSVNQEFDGQGLGEDDAGADELEKSADGIHEPQVRVLGGKQQPEKEEGQRTLGMLLDERLREVRKDSGKDKKEPSKNESERQGAPVVAVQPTNAQATVRPAKTTAAAAPTARPTATPVPTKGTKEDAITPKEEAKQAEPPERGATVRSVLPDGWFAQVAAPKKLSEAEVLVQKLRKAGFAVVVESANVRGENYYRVVVGPEASRVQAERLVEQLKRESTIQGNPFVRRVR